MDSFTNSKFRIVFKTWMIYADYRKSHVNFKLYNFEVM